MWPVRKWRKIFLILPNFEKRHALQNQIRIVVVNDKAAEEQTENLCSSYGKLFSTKTEISRQNVLQYLQDKNLSKLNDDQSTLCNISWSKVKHEVKHELNKIENYKSLGNNDLSK